MPKVFGRMIQTAVEASPVLRRTHAGENTFAKSVMGKIISISRFSESLIFNQVKCREFMWTQMAFKVNIFSS